MIIRQTDPTNIQQLNIFPNQFVLDKEKSKKRFIKTTLDYFAQIGFLQYKRNKETFAKNYDLLKGIISWDDFYSLPEVTDFMSTAMQQEKLPSYVKHYSIINPPINTMVGELTKRPDNHRVRAFDDESQAEEMEYKTDLVQQLILQEARNQIMQKFALSGDDLTEQDLEQLTVEKVEDYLTDYTSLAERWGNHVITCMKAELNMKDKSEDAFRDLLISSREFFHIHEDNSKRGFDVEVANTKNVFHSPNNDRKYSKDWYYGGLLRVMEISEIIERFPWLSKEEIDHLIKQNQEGNYLSPKNSNLNSDRTGPETITYDTFSPLMEQEKMFLEAELSDPSNNDAGYSSLLNQTNLTPFSHRFAVMEVYFISKKLIGKLTYMDQEGVEQVTMVDEEYEEGSPGEISIEWGWINQWYKGVRVGTEVFHLEPFNMLDYCPIIGVTHEIKNTQAKSLVDLMKPFQAIYNVLLNQLWRLLEKEIGVVYNISIRKVPTPKDADHQDALDIWEEEARERGIVFEDDSPENMRAPNNNTNLSKAIDLSRSQEMQTRYEMAAMIKNECWELVGMNRQRLGGVTATETATGTQTALTQSFAQTEPYFAQHEYVMDMVYQAILDTAQYVESTKPLSTISYITANGESAFLQVTPPDIKLKDLHIFSTSRNEDTQLFNEIRMLSQSMLQNGAPVETIIDLYSTNSIRQMKKVAKSLREKQEQMMQQQQQLEQQQIEMQQQQFQVQLEEEARQKELDRVNENINLELDRQNKIEVATINAMGRAQDISSDSNADGTPDIYQVQDLHLKAEEQMRKHQSEIEKLNLERQKLLQEGKFRQQEIRQRDKELEVQKNNDKTDVEIAKLKIEQEKIKLKAAKHKATEARNKPKPKSK